MLVVCSVEEHVAIPTSASQINFCFGMPLVFFTSCTVWGGGGRGLVQDLVHPSGARGVDPDPEVPSNFYGPPNRWWGSRAVSRGTPNWPPHGRQLVRFEPFFWPVCVD